MDGHGSRVSGLSHEDLSCFSNLDDEDPDDLLLDDSDVDMCFADVDTAWQDRMKAALSSALSSGTLTPLLKEELHCKIQLRRLQSGKEEMQPDFSVKPAVMTMEEVMKKNRKMEQNRMSAQKSRDRRKSLEKTVQARLELLEKDNKLLRGQAESLRHASQVAHQWLLQHCACPEHCIASLSTSVSAAGPSFSAEPFPRPVSSRHKSDSDNSTSSGSTLPASSASSFSFRRVHSESSPLTTSCRHGNNSGSSSSLAPSRRQKSLSSSSSSSVSASDFSSSDGASSSRHSSVESSSAAVSPARLLSSSDDSMPSVGNQHNVFACVVEPLPRNNAN